MRPACYPSGQEIHAGDRIFFQSERTRILFVKPINEFAEDISPDDWEFMPADTIGVEFDDGRFMSYDSFCHHDEIVLLSRAGADSIATTAGDEAEG